MIEAEICRLYQKFDKMCTQYCRIMVEQISDTSYCTSSKQYAKATEKAMTVRKILLIIDTLILFQQNLEIETSIKKFSEWLIK